MVDSGSNFATADCQSDEDADDTTATGDVVDDAGFSGGSYTTNYSWADQDLAGKDQSTVDFSIGGGGEVDDAIPAVAMDGEDVVMSDVD